MHACLKGYELYLASESSNVCVNLEQNGKTYLRRARKAELKNSD